VGSPFDPPSRLEETIMPRPTPIPIRRAIVERRRAGQSLVTIALELDLKYDTVRNLWRRYRRKGEAGLIPDYHRCGRRRASSPGRMMRAACWLKRHHSSWGARLIHDLLRQRWPDCAIPSPRSLQRGFRAAGMNRPGHLSRNSDHPLRQGLGQREHRRDGDEQDWAWMLGVLQCKIPVDDLRERLKRPIDLDILVDAIKDGGLKQRNKAMVILALEHGITRNSICNFLHLSPKTVSGYCRIYAIYGCERLMEGFYKRVKKSDDELLENTLFSVLHAPPRTYGFNRTIWIMADLRKALATKGQQVCAQVIRKIIRDAGYTWKKARRVLTSNDPEYKEKLAKIQAILSNLGPDERFFSIDEYGPFAVKMQGGRALTPPGKVRTVPQRQKSKGSLIVTAALELSTNQVTHFCSEKKNTAEMIKLLDVLLKDYACIAKISFSWDAASWHASKALYKRVEEVNSPENRARHRTPLVELVPLPSCAQFLNVIESVFSGMSRAVIQNSDYESVEACKAAIDRHFADRNAFFRANSRRAGRKIWGKETTPSEFSESNNCKDPHQCFFGF
jgi:transposase